ncbi:MAG: flagellar export chaperone FlgN [Rubripirellula sp.]|jgi:Spy/CpxP family protein refolding chaperone
MNGNEVAALIQQRWEILDRLLSIGRLQMRAIEQGQMSELMRLLSEKQKPLNRLIELGGQLEVANADHSDERYWDSDDIREQCRKQQDDCEQMNLELLAIEAECESKLSQNRDELRQRLERVDSGWQAVSGYVDHAAHTTSGGSLDLSSD